jgi:hypothetical protein
MRLSNDRYDCRVASVSRGNGGISGRVAWGFSGDSSAPEVGHSMGPPQLVSSTLIQPSVGHAVRNDGRRWLVC